MGLRLFADGEREQRPPLVPVDACLRHPERWWRAFAIVVLFPHPLRYGVGFGGSVRMVYCAAVDCR